ncbi:putative Oligosaccharyl transferase STT3 subunit [Leishmania shawi]|uniref:dolichyl-diphosphooligosaccharide--protein glycotransferase n=1 Tax=Leishmania shawi TaxID=5680 RepID=A0AAW3B8N1_9TRYP
MGKKKAIPSGSVGPATTTSREAPGKDEGASLPAKTAALPVKPFVLPNTLTDEEEFVGIFPCPLWPVRFVITVMALVLLGASCIRAFTIRMLSVQLYGYIIHEFDPWFNYRAAEYMSAHGWSAFFSWFDYMSWYPLGRPVGTTTYPGLQLTAVAIHRALAAAGVPMSLNNVCVLIQHT